MKNIELLAPAGDQESLIAAVQNGANAIYLGGTLFNARAFAKNFDHEQMMENTVHQTKILLEDKLSSILMNKQPHPALTKTNAG